MQIDGIYAFVYSVANGLGLGVFAVRNGQVQGRDYAQASYRGTAAVQSDGSIELDLHMTVPPGVELVQGTSPQEIPYQRQIKHRFPAGFGDGEPVRISSPPGEVIVMVKRVSDELEEAATDGFTIQIAQRLTQQ